MQLALVACYIPWGFLALLFAVGIENGMAWIAAETMMYLNPSLNPILYCWKIREVRQAVKDIIRQLNCICRCLAIADLGVGLLVQPFYVAFIMSPLIEINGHDVFSVLQVGLTLCWCLGQVSILTLAAISVDRLLALLLGLRYRHVVSLW